MAALGDARTRHGVQEPGARPAPPLSAPERYAGRTEISTGADPAFRADVLAGLAAFPPAIPARWFYDRRGSELFEAITGLPEYYPTRTERALLERHASDVARIAGA